MNQVDNNTSLSMIDCGIKSLKDIPLKYNLTSINLHSNLLTKIENLTYLQQLVQLDLSSNKITKIYGLHGLVSLKTLNLSCNLIVAIENLDGLKKLTYLNLSYNKIQYVNGLSDLWGTDYSIETILLNSNFITSLEEISYYLTGLSRLKHLTINDNKFLKTIDYRPFLFKSVKQLVSLDGKDKTNKTVNYKTPSQPILDDIIELTKPTNKPIGASPKVKKKEIELNQIEENEDDTVSSFGPKLDQIEDKIHKLLLLRDKIKHNDDDFDRLTRPRSTPPHETRPQRPLISILKPSPYNNQSTSTSDITNDSTSTNSSSLNELIKTLQEQLNNYKKSQDDNQSIINDLKKKLEQGCGETMKLMKEKDDLINQEKDKNKELTKHLDEMKSKLEQSGLRIKQFEIQMATQSAKKEEKMKYCFQNELKNLKDKHESLIKEKTDKITALEASYKQLEDEFRSALMIESNRFNELYTKYESSSQEFNQLKNDLKTAQQNDSRNKSLITELNDLIKEQKNRIQILTRVRKETSEDIHKRNEKLNEAVADCVKLKAQCEQMKKEKAQVESNLKKVLVEFDSIKKERYLWNTKLTDQKNFFLQENNRLEVENKKLKSDLDLQTSSLNKEADNCKIKSKIIEDQTETIRKLKNALVERDEMLKKAREDALNTQKSLEKQLNDEMDLSNELQIKLEKANEKKEALKSEYEKLRLNLEETKRTNDELAGKWREKSNIMKDLEVEVRKMKENFAIKEKSLLEKNEKLVEENGILNNRLRKIDDDFRHQYDAEKKEHLKHIEKLKSDNLETIKKYEDRIKDLEDEMRLILIESENKKKFYDDKISSFTAMFSKFQADLKTNN